jgi:hypothetical protein
MSHRGLVVLGLMIATLAFPGAAITATVQYKIWRELVGRVEYRHDQADEKVFKIRRPGLVPTGDSQDTITLALYYSFF